MNSSVSLRKLAVLTSGGDSPSMNAAVYGFVASANARGVDVYAVIDGYKGLVNGHFEKIDVQKFRDCVYKSGTAIGSSRCLEFKVPSVRLDACEKFKKQGFDGLFVIGGDGSYMGASLISELGCNVVTAPGTIDNDVASSHYTIGFFSALEEIFQAIQKVRSTSESHSQVTFVETMGRHCNDLTVAAAVAGAVDYVVTGENPTSVDKLVDAIKKMINSGKKGIVILVTEKVFGDKYEFGLPSLSDLCPMIEKEIGRQVRFNVIGYTQRGAFPVSWDLFMANGFGMRAFELMSEGKFGVAIGFDGNDFYTTPLKEAVTMKKKSKINLINFINSFYKI